MSLENIQHALQASIFVFGLLTALSGAGSYLVGLKLSKSSELKVSDLERKLQIEAETIRDFSAEFWIDVEGAWIENPVNTPQMQPVGEDYYLLLKVEGLPGHHILKPLQHGRFTATSKANVVRFTSYQSSRPPTFPIGQNFEALKAINKIEILLPFLNHGNLDRMPVRIHGANLKFFMNGIERGQVKLERQSAVTAKVTPHSRAFLWVALQISLGVGDAADIFINSGSISDSP